MVGCAPAGPLAVIDPAAWTAISPDPLDSSQDCAAEAMQLEAGLVEIDTTLCNWVTMDQPSLAKVREGDLLDVFAFHSALSAAEPATGRMAVWIDDELVWEVTPPIPSAEGIYSEQVVAPSTAPAGSEVRLHISNHGGNSWRFVSLERQ